MRLLSRTNGTLSLTPDLPAKQAYAILSHTWGKDEEEVTFQDIIDGEIYKPGFQKIDFCLRQAAQDGYDHVWVDTCCIDKRDRNELGKAINMMYEYYRDSAICYVYLSDIEPGSTDITRSRWFTRGWTLQELIAPKNLRFYAGSRLLGDRSLLLQQIKAACGIDVTVALKDTSILQRYKWSLNRKTREPEDQHYCLIGLLELENKPIFNYGEGAHSSRERLFEEIEKEHGRRTGRQVREAFAAAASITREGQASQIMIDQVLSSLRFPGMDVRRQAISNPLPGTYTWLLTHPEFEAWYHMRGQRFLWIKGKPGAGKSTIIKYADSLTESDADSVLHLSYYFNARGSEMEHCAFGMYQSLLFQLLQKVPELQQPLITLIEQSRNALSWTIHSLQNALQRMVKILEQPVRCFVDALDEGTTEDVQAMVWFLQDLTCPLLQVCFASRHYPTVTIRHSVEIVLDTLHRDDIKRYVDERLDAEGALRDRLRSKILDKANGIFLWAVLVVQILNKELREGCIFDLEMRLKDLPPSLADLFEDIILKSSEDDERFRLCLYWILFSKDWISGETLYYAMEAGLRPDRPSYRSPGVDDMVTEKHIAKFVSSSSRGLAEVPSYRVQIIHESVREYLLSQDTLYKLHPGLVGNVYHWIFQALKRICGDYISTVLSAQPSISRLSSGFNYCFLDYAATGFIYFTEQAARYSAQSDALDMLDSQTWQEFYSKHEFCSWHIFYPRFESCIKGALHSFSAEQLRREGWPNRDSSLMHILVRYNAVRLIQQACAMQKPIESPGCESPLFLAFDRSYVHAARALIDGGANLEAKGSKGETILLAMIRRWDVIEPRQPDILTLLLQKGANIEACDELGERALFRAIESGSHNLVKMLLQFGADMRTPDPQGQTALILATSLERQKIIELLIEHGADVDQQNSAGDTALLLACRTQPIQIVQCLLELDATITATNYGGRTVIMEAASRFSGFDHIVLRGLDAGVNVNEQDTNGSTALLDACKTGNLSLMRMLMSRGANVNITDNDGRTVLMEACDQPDKTTASAMSQLTLEAGAYAVINKHDFRGNTALMSACLSSNVELITILLEQGADRDGTIAAVKEACNIWSADFDWDVEQHCRDLLQR